MIKQNKTCSNCKKLKALVDFYNKKNGTPRPSCIECHSNYGKASYDKNKIRISGNGFARVAKNPEKEAARLRLYYENNRELIMWRSAKNRATENGWLFNIEPKDIIIPDFCPILGFKLERTKGSMTHSPSLDRIDNSKGYILGNIRVISWRANDLKADGTLDEMKLIVADLESIQKP